MTIIHRGAYRERNTLRMLLITHPLLFNFKVLFLQCVGEGDFFGIFKFVFRSDPVFIFSIYCIARGKSYFFFVQRSIVLLMVEALSIRNFKIFHIVGF